MSESPNEKTSNGEIKDIPFIPVISFPPDTEDNLIKKAFFSILITILLAGLTAVSYLFFYPPSEEGATFKESQMGSAAAIYNLLFLLSIVLIFSIILYIMIKKRMLNLLTIMQALLLGFVGGSIISFFLVLWFYEGLILLNNVINLDFLFNSIDTLIMVLQIAIDILFIIIGALIVLSITSNRFAKYRNPLLILLSATTGGFLGLSLGEITPIILMIGFAIYDIFAVFKGPLKLITEELRNIVEEEGEELKTKTGLLLGLGDLFFYSLAVGYSIAYLGWLPTALVGVTLSVGATYTIGLVLKSKRKRALPALPIPIFLSIGIIVLFYLI